MSFDFKGVSTALVTPFKDGEVDLASYERVVRLNLDKGVEGLVVNGTTGESPTLNPGEIEMLFQRTQDIVAGQVPVIMGTGSNSTQKTIEMTQFAERMKADLALVVTPYYNKPTQAGIIKHFEAICAETNIPLMLYNVPGRTITKIEVDTFRELQKLDQIIGAKEATGDIEFAKKLFPVMNEDFVLVSGDDGTCFDFCLQGGHGVISVMSNAFPSQTREWMDKARAGQADCIQGFAEYKDVIDAMYSETNPIGIKMALKLMGVIDSAEMRLPMTEMTEPATAALKKALEKRGLI